MIYLYDLLRSSIKTAENKWQKNVDLYLNSMQTDWTLLGEKNFLTSAIIRPTFDYMTKSEKISK